MRLVMKATQETNLRQAVATPLAYLGANYENREGWLSLTELRRYVWGKDLTVAQLHKIIHQLPVTVVHDRVRWVGLSGAQPTGRGFRLRKRLMRKLWVFRLIPFVRMVGVMNSLAAGCVAEDSDIDIFVVTKAGRLWTVRAMTLALLVLFGMRARAEDKAGRLSVDLFVSEDGLDLSQSGAPVDYLLAYWVSDFTPVLYPEKFRELWAANRWVKDFLPVAYRSPRQWGEDTTSVRPSGMAKLLEWCLESRLGDVVERWTKGGQMRRIDKNVKRFAAEGGGGGLLIVNDKVVKIHFDDAKRHRINQAVGDVLAG